MDRVPRARRGLSRRAAGLLLHPTSLPGPVGIGEIGPAALRWVERLRETGIGAWQTLPLGPTGFGDSPYQTLSSFAGNPLLVSLEILRGEGWLRDGELGGAPGAAGSQVDFGALIPWKRERLRRATEAWRRRSSAAERRELEEFRQRAGGWLEDFALFAALKDAYGGAPWWEWPSSLARRERSALRQARRKWAEEIERRRIEQWWFERQWAEVRRTARRAGVRVIGDVPIFSALDSADVWARPDLFELDRYGRPTAVAGVPPDYFSATGQLWGNPLYRWPAHAEEGYAWWIARLRRALELADAVRLDHFRGFEAYWAVPAGSLTAAAGRWVPGPGADFLKAVRAALGGLPLIAEDLGFITPAVTALRRQFRLPGMLVLQFAMERLLTAGEGAPEECPVDTVCYTGTHDNDTAQGWLRSVPGGDSTEDAERHRRLREAAMRYVGGDARDFHWGMIGLAWRSRARLAVAPLQDVLGLGREGRMNTPGRPAGNWRWRVTEAQSDAADWERLRRLTEREGRL